MDNDRLKPARVVAQTAAAARGAAPSYLVGGPGGAAEAQCRKTRSN